MKEKRTLGIIGVGPRGLFALENYLIELALSNSLSQIHIYLFEETGDLGNGQIYGTEQVGTNWLNISERVLTLDKRNEINCGVIRIPTFPSYHDWIDKDPVRVPKNEIDYFPPRSKLGQYLKERCETLIGPLLEIELVTVVTERVEEIDLSDQNKVCIKTDSSIHPDIDEILLTIGHQPTYPSDQIKEWEQFAQNKKDVFLFSSPYPIKDLLGPEVIHGKSSIGIRGFGLAMIDVVRSIATKLGKFTISNELTRSCVYRASDGSGNVLFPFSLDGLPPAPKPVNSYLDEQYKPSKEQILGFEKSIGDRSAQENATSPKFLVDAFAAIAAKIYLELPRSYSNGSMTTEEAVVAIRSWLSKDGFEHSNIIPIHQGALRTMKDHVAMAVGEKEVSMDYCVGQVWRHCQPSIYEKLSFNACSDQVFKQIIDLDEWTKRYSYGPPVESIQQLIALTEAKLMDLDLVNDPNFELKEDGWLMEHGNKKVTVNIMINSVIDPPKIESVCSAIIKDLLSNKLISSVHDELGVATDDNAYVISDNEKKSVPIALLGRLAKGTVIGVDAILECFGERPKSWAAEAARKHEQWLIANDRTGH